MNIKIQTYRLMALVFVLSGVAMAQALTPATYIDIELKVRQITNDGMKQRLFLIKLQSEDSVEDQYELDAETFNLIDAVFSGQGVTAGTHAAYGTQNAELIDSYLSKHPDKRQQLELVQSEFEFHSSQISAALTGQ